MFVIAPGLYARTGPGWGLFPALFLVPALSFAGYLARPRVGGYGLKYTRAFDHTHLGHVGRATAQERTPAPGRAL